MAARNNRRHKKGKSSEIGLKRGTVKFAAHNLTWSKLFQDEKKQLLKLFPDEIIEISHGGSTAIPSIPAKPIIDMFAAVKSLKGAENIRTGLEKLGYEYRGEDGVSERILYVKGGPEMRTHHLQLVERTSKEWKNHIIIRDYFLKHPEMAKDYAELKIKLAEKYPNDRKSYTHGKNRFIKLIIERANNEGFVKT